MGTLSPSFIGSLFRFFSFFSVISLGKLFLYFSLYVPNLKARNLLTSGVVLKFLLGMLVILQVYLKYPHSLSTFHQQIQSSESGRYSAKVVLVGNVDHDMELLSVYTVYVLLNCFKQ